MAGVREIYDHRGDVVREVRYDTSDPDRFTTVSYERHDETLESNKALREAMDPKSNVRLAARIPVTVIEQAAREGWLHDNAAWRKWLNDPANRDHRVWEGHV